MCLCHNAILNDIGNVQCCIRVKQELCLNKNICIVQSSLFSTWSIALFYYMKQCKAVEVITSFHKNSQLCILYFSNFGSVSGENFTRDRFICLSLIMANSHGIFDAFRSQCLIHVTGSMSICSTDHLVRYNKLMNSKTKLMCLFSVSLQQTVRKYA